MRTGTSGSKAQRLAAAHLVGAAAVGIVAQIVVHMPGGLLGPRETTTPVGATYGAVLGVAALWAVVAAWRGRGLPRPVAPAILSLNVGAFAPALPHDPLVAGMVILWSMTLLVRHLVPAVRGAGVRAAAGAGPPADRRLATSAPVLLHLAGVSLALDLGVVGYRMTSQPLAGIVCLVLGFGVLAAAVPLLLAWRRAGRRGPLLVALPAAAALATLAWLPTALTLLAVAQSVLLALLLGRLEITREILGGFLDHPSRLIVASFAGLIVVGTVALTFPAAAAGGRPIDPLDALFTATSAACVTGLIVLDTPVDFSPFGQVVILLLFQAGGLGIMTLSTFATLLLGGSLGLRGERALTRVLDQGAADTAYRLARFIVLSTLAVEAVGALVLGFAFHGAGLGPGEAAWRGVFHAVSAFCNAGFALQSDSLHLFAGRPAPLLVVAALITLGGFGFAVLAGLANRWLGADRRPLTPQVRTVLALSALLVVAGTALYAAVEWRRSLAGMAPLHKLVNALFQSVTLRTAGFDSVDFAALAPATAVMMIAFMFVGASPGSTGGGIKTTTFAVLLAALRSSVEGEPPHLFAREVPGSIVYRSVAIAGISAAAIVGGLFLLLLLEPGDPLSRLFEVVSAFGTVGLSLGATAELGPAGKLIIIGLMFAGRIGPLTLALLLGTGRARGPRLRRPTTRLMVG